MKKTFKKIIGAITFPFTAMAILIDESKNINEHGDWDEYHARKNRKVNRNA